MKPMRGSVFSGLLMVAFFVTNPIQAVQNTAVSPVVTSDVHCGDRRLFVREIPDYEDSRVELTVHDLQGKQISSLIEAKGTFVSLCEQSAFLLLDNSSHFRPGESLLMSKDLKQIATFDFGEIKDFGTSSDQAIFWIQNHLSQSGRPVTRVRVYTSAGERILDKIFLLGENLTLDHEGVHYLIRVLEPDFPG